MPLILLVRFLFSILSLILLGFLVYLLWTWYQGDLVENLDGEIVRVREDWRLWTALAIAAWSLLGRFIIAPLLARGDSSTPSSSEQPEGQTVTGATGANLHVESLGPPDGAPIVLTHGAASDTTVWFNAKSDLSKRFRVIAWDLPGLGRSKPASLDKVGLDEYATDLATVIVLTDRPVVLVGHSMGGMTIQTLARDNPDFFRRHVAGVVLVNTTYTNPLKTMILPRLAQALRFPVIEPLCNLMIWLQPLAWLGAWNSYLNGTSHIANRIGFGRYVTRSQLNHMTLISTRNPPASIGKGNLAMFRWDATGALAKTGVPVLVLAGDIDIVTKPEAGRAIADMTPTATYRVIEGVNHMGFMERPDVYNQAIAEFAASVQPTATVASGQ